MNTPAEELIASLKPVRNRVRPLTSEWLQMRAMLERANLEREDVLARAWKWQAAIAVTAFLVGGLLGRIVQ